MRTDVVEQYRGSLKGSRRIRISNSPSVDLSHYSIRASGSGSLTQKDLEMPNPIFSSTLEKFFSYLSSSSRAVKLLNVSYWTFMGLSCIAFFIFPWYLFLAFLIPALIMLLFREVHKTSQACLNYKGPA